VRIVVTGAAGRLGGVLCVELASAGHDLLKLDRDELDITRAEQVTAVIGDLQPEVIINCAAYNAVDAAETNRAAAFALNAHGPALLAAAANVAGALFVHFGSDFVFDGEAGEAYTEARPTNPLNVYGASKLAGEAAASRASRHYILRVSSLFGGVGFDGHRATVDYIADSLLSGTTVRAAVDRTVTPSYAPDVARAILAMLAGHVPYGTYHCTNPTATTWYGLAQEVARQLGSHAGIESVRAADLSTIAPRPKACGLVNQKLASLGILMPTWQSAIRRHLVSRHAPAAAHGGR
jgi:dTDP-4-dehydrorhamnose reductase